MLPPQKHRESAGEVTKYGCLLSDDQHREDVSVTTFNVALISLFQVRKYRDHVKERSLIRRPAFLTAFCGGIGYALTESKSLDLRK